MSGGVDVVDVAPFRPAVAAGHAAVLIAGRDGFPQGGRHRFGLGAVVQKLAVGSQGRFVDREAGGELSRPAGACGTRRALRHLLPPT